MTTTNTSRFPLTAKERATYAQHWLNLRVAAAKAAAAFEKRQRRSAALDDLAARSGWDDIRTADTKAVNLGLRNAKAEHELWTTETQRISALLAGELAARELLGVDLATAAADAVRRPAPAPRTAPTMAKVG
ncbi:hypothetical protein [Micromonospora sp. 4G55]|uniref:hypothetical protein n=1 Tax=Micromonospora sp. 4G55 TaxID=2806102 RepID=UPI001A5E2AB6|nr:hypothetical protein [Micromonospora sp. 4G55]MBM0256377.1 hypothetical protein [Micromonospora sp. 4G55]